MNRRYSSGSPFEPIIGFSRAVRIGNRVEVAGTVALDANGELVGPGDPEAQADRCLQIIVEAIEALGLSRTDVIRTRTYLVRAEDWEAVGRAHGRVFSDVRPASTMVVAAGLLKTEWLVEIEATAESSEV